MIWLRKKVIHERMEKWISPSEAAKQKIPCRQKRLLIQFVWKVATKQILQFDSILTIFRLFISLHIHILFVQLQRWLHFRLMGKRAFLSITSLLSLRFPLSTYLFMYVPITHDRRKRKCSRLLSRHVDGTEIDDLLSGHVANPSIPKGHDSIAISMMARSAVVLICIYLYIVNLV